MIYDNGFNNLLTKTPLFQENIEAQNAFSNGISSQVIGSGDMAYNANLVDGYMQSSNFVSGSAGWQINSNGDAEFESGYFRGDISAATGTFGGTIPFSGISTGTNEVALNVGNGNVKIDGANKRIIINDGTNDRILLGFLSGKF
jgi:hypothetical protein